MIGNLASEAEHDASWLAIRQPAVVRLLEIELSSGDGDAFAAGLELACRLLGGRNPIGEMRLDHHALAAGLESVRSGRCDRAMVKTLREHIDSLPVALNRSEQDAVATVTAAIIWAVFDTSVGSFTA